MIREGLKKSEIIRILEKKLSQDNSYESGYILGSMCSEPIDFGKEIYVNYLSKNLGDPGLFQGTANLEKELISEIGMLFGGKNIVGSITTGGTEANIMAMRIAKKLRPDIENPETPEIQYILKEEITTLQQQIRTLNKTLRVPLVLHYIEGLPIHQIADLTGKTEGAIKVSLHRARTLLRKELENV